MAKSKEGFEKRQEPENQSLKQGYVREEDLEPEAEGKKVMTGQEVDSYAQKAKANAGTKGDELQGEGDYEAAESYNDAATDFAQKQDGNKRGRP